MWVSSWRLRLSDVLPQWRHTLRHIHTPPAAAMMVGAFLSYSLHPCYLHLQSCDASSNNEHLSCLCSFWSFSVSPQQEGLDDGPDFLSEEDRGVSYFLSSFLLCVCAPAVCCACLLCVFVVRGCVYYCWCHCGPVCVCPIWVRLFTSSWQTSHTQTLECTRFTSDSPVWWQSQKLGQEPTSFR